MNKKLMLLAAGALTALAFAALPALASAGEFVSTCEKGPGKVCTGSISGGPATLTDDSGSSLGKIECSSATGIATATGGSTTGTVELTFAGCQDEFLKTKCFNTGLQAEGKITTNTMMSHNVYLEPDKSVKGVLLTGTKVTFTCPSVGVTKTVTGDIIGEITNPQCTTPASTHTITFTTKSPIPANPASEQKWTQVTTVGAIFDLTSGAQGSDATTSAQIGTGAISWPVGEKVALDC
jgi:hypothetical protein